jgi:hypothetical protein
MTRTAPGKLKFSGLLSYEKRDARQDTESGWDRCAYHPNQVAGRERYAGKTNRCKKGSPSLNLDSFRPSPLPATATYNLRDGAHTSAERPAAAAPRH